MRRAYCEETYCPERDCRYILAACAAVLGGVIGAVTMRCGRKWLRQTENFMQKGLPLCEGRPFRYGYG